MFEIKKKAPMKVRQVILLGGFLYVVTMSGEVLDRELCEKGGDFKKIKGIEGKLGKEDKLTNISKLADDVYCFIISRGALYCSLTENDKENHEEIKKMIDVNSPHPNGLGYLIKIAKKKPNEMVLSTSDPKGTFFVLTNLGRVFGCGENEYGQLGLGDYNPREVMTLVSFFDSNSVFVKQVSAGSCHSLFLTKKGQVYGCGGSSYSLRLGVEGEFINMPDLIEGFSKGKIKKISSGQNHSLFLTTCGIVYGFGNNSYGKLCAKNFSAVVAPKQLSILGTSGIEDIFAMEDQSFFSDKTGKLFACGKNYMGQLGNDFNWQSDSGPKLVEGVNNCVDIQNSDNKTILVERSGKVFIAGGGASGCAVGIQFLNEILLCSQDPSSFKFRKERLDFLIQHLQKSSGPYSLFFVGEKNDKHESESCYQTLNY